MGRQRLKRVISVSILKYLRLLLLKANCVHCLILDFGMILMLVVPWWQSEEVVALLFQREVVCVYEPVF